jgi:hypothetical protein
MVSILYDGVVLHIFFQLCSGCHIGNLKLAILGVRNHGIMLQNIETLQIWVFKPFRATNADLCFHGMFLLGNRDLILFIWLLKNFLSISLLRVPYPSRQPYWIEFLLRNLKWLPSYGVHFWTMRNSSWFVLLRSTGHRCHQSSHSLFSVRAASLLWLPDPLTPNLRYQLCILKLKGIHTKVFECSFEVSTSPLPWP